MAVKAGQQASVIVRTERLTPQILESHEVLAKYFLRMSLLCLSYYQSHFKTFYPIIYLTIKILDDEAFWTHSKVFISSLGTLYFCQTAHHTVGP